jgi:phosphate transport system substrate-binding protein
MTSTGGTGGGALVYRGTHILTYGALRELGNLFNLDHPDAVRVFGGGCDDGITAVQQGKADLGGMCCPTAGSRAKGMKHLLLARDLKVVLVHPDNPVSGLSLASLRAIAHGNTKRWSDIGGKDRAIALVVRRHCAHFREPVRRALVGGPERRWSSRALAVNTSEQLVNTVARFSGAIGVGSWVFAAPLVRRGALRVLPVNDIYPTIANAINGAYGLTGPLSIVYRDWDAGRMAPFLDFLFSAKGRRIISRNLVPVSARQAGYDLIRRG